MLKRYSLGPATELTLTPGDITRVELDAVVNAANERMLGGGGVDGAIHRASGPELLAACEQLPEVKPGVRCPTGEARITPGFALPARWVIHTAGPIYRGPQSATALSASYRSCLLLAAEHSVRTIAFPAVSCGVYGYPLADAAGVALQSCIDHGGPLCEIRFVLFDDPAYDAWLAAAEQRLSPLL